MNKKRIIYLMFILVQILLIIKFIKPLTSETVRYDYDYSQMLDYSALADISDKGYHISEDTAAGYKGIFTYNPFFNLSKGSYLITVNYTASTSDNTAILSSNSYETYNSLKAETILLSKNKTSVTFNAYLNENIKNVHIITNYGGTGDFTVSSASIVQTHDMERVALVKLLFLLAVIDTIVLLNHYGVLARMSREQINCGVLLCGAVILVSYPLMTNGITAGSDLIFHILRIEGLRDGILAGMFPVKVQPTWLEGYGYAVSVFYGDLLLYFPAMLRIIGFSIQSSYKIFLTAINIATCISGYYCFRGILKKRYFAAFATALYLLFPYRIYGMYLGHTVGECSALIFLPLIILGLYRTFTENTDAKSYRYNFLLLTLGYSGLINCHVLTTMMTGFFTLILCILCIKKTLRPATLTVLIKTVLLSLLISCWYIVPFLDYYREPFQVNTAQNTLWIQSFGLQLTQLLQMFPTYDTSIDFSSDTPLTHIKNTGITVIVLAIIFLYAYITSDKEKRKTARPMLICLIFGCTTLFMATCYFPWDPLRRFLGLYGLKNIVNSIQDPTRFMQLATILLIIPGCYSLTMLEQLPDFSGMIKNITSICVVILIITSGYDVNYVINTRKENAIYDIQQYVQTHTWSLNEYLPVDTDTSYLTSIGLVEGDGVTVSDYDKNYLDIRCHVTNTSKAASYIDVPLIYYKGYQTCDDNGNYLNTYNGKNNNVVRIDIPAGYSGNIHTCFKQRIIWRISEVISAISMISAIAYYLYIKHKLKKL